MLRSEERILTTHCGSLPRPDALLAPLRAKDAGAAYDATALAAAVRRSVVDVVRHQVALGIDVVDDGEHSKSNFTAYLRTRLAGFSQTDRPYNARPPTRDYLAFPAVYDENRVMLAARPTTAPRVPAGMRSSAITGPVSYIGQREVAADIDNLKAGLAAHPAPEAFVTALSPNNLEVFYRNEYYSKEDDYLAALADALHEEYRIIVDSGFLLQIDDPQLVTYYDRNPGLSLEQCRAYIARRVEVLNHALRGLPEERVRYHTCYSTNVAPRMHDLELKHFVDLMLKIRAGGYSIEASNPRHEHEWQVFETVKLPPGKILIPGVVSHCVHLVEHPELVAQRIERFARVAGRENVIASNDCGFATSAVGDHVHPDVAWAKLAALTEGARIATKRLWGRA